MLNKIKYYLYGKSASISVFKYRSYNSEISKYFQAVNNASDADVVIASYVHDIETDILRFNSCKAKNNAKAVILSEEPLWDHSWSTNIQVHNNQYFVENREKTVRADFELFNHSTSDIYEYEYIPHFLTTNDLYIKNYIHNLKNFSKIRPSTLYNIKKYDVTGIFSRRLVNEPNNFAFSNSKQGKCLNTIKNDLADLLVDNDNGLNCDFFGYNNSQLDGLTDDTIYDGYTFHRKKIDWCNTNSRFLFALENTIQKNYITEKVFDAVCSFSVPIYFCDDEKIKLKGINLDDFQATSIHDFYDFCLDSILSIDFAECVEYNFELARFLFENWEDKVAYERKTRVNKIFNYISSML